MRSRRRGSPKRFRIGRVSVYPHHGAWWVYYRDAGQPVRQKVALEHKDAEQIAAQINSQLASGAPLLLSFSPTTVAHLRESFLGHHEFVLKSSVATIQRYRAATQHLEAFTLRDTKSPRVHEVCAENFVRYLREIQVAPNGHQNTKRRNLRDKGIQFIPETCRAMYGFAARRRHLPPYMGNPFATLPLDRLKIEDSKPIFLFNAESELAFLRRADVWGFPIHFTLAKTGMRSGELCHLLIEEVDLEGGWLHVRNKTSLGWRIKTGNERAIPLLGELVALLRVVIANRKAGPVFSPAVAVISRASHSIAPLDFFKNTFPEGPTARALVRQANFATDFDPFSREKSLNRTPHKIRWTNTPTARLGSPSKFRHGLLPILPTKTSEHTATRHSLDQHTRHTYQRSCTGCSIYSAFAPHWAAPDPGLGSPCFSEGSLPDAHQPLLSSSSRSRSSA